MKKFILSICLTVLLMPVFAGGIRAGQTYVSAFGGAVAPSASYNHQPADADEYLDYGDEGPSYGMQIMHFLTPHFGIGAEVNGTNYLNADYQGQVYHYVSKAERYSLFIAGRINFNPEGKTRFYIPLGAGYNHFKGTIKIGEEEGAQSCNEPAAYGGLGAETDINDTFVFGAEGRYNVFWIDRDKYYHTKNLSDIAFLVKFGIKF